MKKLLFLFLLPLSLVAQTSNVQKSTSTNSITADLTFGSGRTLTIASGATLSVSGTATVSGLLQGTPSLTALGAISPGTGLLPYFNSSTSATTTPLTTFSAGLLGDAAATDWRTGLGVGNPNATYVLQTADSTLPSAFALGTLSTGLLKVTATTGALSTAVAGTDYLAPGSAIAGSTGSTDTAILRANGTGGSTAQGSVVTLSTAGAFGFPAGVKQTFNPNGTNAGINVGSVTSDPASPANGDLWYNSTTPALNARINGATVALGAGGGGGIGGSTGATDKAILIANGTAGATLQNSLITIGATGIIGFPAGIKQTFAPSTTTAGINFGSVSSDPSVLANGDAWYQSGSGIFKGKIGAGGTQPFLMGPTSATTSGDLVTFNGTTGALAQDSGISAASGAITSNSSLTLASATGSSTFGLILQPASAGSVFNQGYVLQGPSSPTSFKGNQNALGNGTGIYPTYLQASAVDGIAILSAATTPESIIELQAAGGSLSAMAATPNASKSSIRFTTTSTGSVWREAANIDFVATEIGSSGAGSQIDFYTTATGTTTRTKQLTIANNGAVLAYNPTAGIGYTTGSGGAVTQITSRTTGVTLNTVSGAITLVSAAGLATYQTFTVTDSAVAATDTVTINQKSGSDIYIITVHAVAAGSFQVSYATTGGTTTEQPVFQFNVIKGSNS